MDSVARQRRKFWGRRLAGALSIAIALVVVVACGEAPKPTPSGTPTPWPTATPIPVPPDATETPWVPAPPEVMAYAEDLCVQYAIHDGTWGSFADFLQLYRNHYASIEPPPQFVAFRDARLAFFDATIKVAKSKDPDDEVSGSPAGNREWMVAAAEDTAARGKLAYHEKRALEGAGC